MANRNSKASQAHDARLNLRTSCHVPHSWLHSGAENNPDAQFASMVLDVSRGTEVIASILCNHLTDLDFMADKDDDTSPLLSKTHTEALARLMLFSLKQLHEASNARINEFNRKAEMGAQA